MINFRLEEAGEAPHIHDLVHKTFGQDAEAVLVEDLCNSGDALVSVVAMDDDELVGHILFSDTPINTSRGLLRGAALAPLSVSGLRQGQGIGGGLVMQGLRECREEGIQAVVVLGDPDYYGRFGFAHETTANLDCPYKGEHFLGLELEPGVLKDTSGRVLFPDPFKKLD